MLGTKNWSTVASFLPGRLGRQCRDHWFSVLDPEIKRTAWSLEEDLFIVANFLQQGPKWVKIANLPQMRGRSVAAVKNRYYLHLKGREEHIIQAATR
jgi:hypothetical protein